MYRKGEHKKKKGKGIQKAEEDLIYQGSASIEAAFVVPLILVMFAMIIYVTFFLYDECSAWQCCYIAVLRADTVTGQEDQKEGLAEGFLKDLLGEELMAVQGIELKRERKGKSLSVQVNGNTLTGDRLHMGTKFWNFEARGEAVMLKPVQFIRRYRLAEGVWKQIKGETE